MCKYCEMEFSKDFPSLGVHGSTMATTLGASCEIAKCAGEYYIKIWAVGEGLSKEPIKFCPFCGKSLTE
jgi:hypothetical protein